MADNPINVFSAYAGQVVTVLDRNTPFNTTVAELQGNPQLREALAVKIDAGLVVAANINGQALTSTDIRNIESPNNLTGVAWQTAGQDYWLPMPRSNFRHACSAFATLNNGKLFACGGEDFHRLRGSAKCEEFGPVAGTWTAKADMPEPALCHGATVINNGQDVGSVLAFGGYHSPYIPTAPLPSAHGITGPFGRTANWPHFQRRKSFLWNPKTNVWTQSGSFPWKEMVGVGDQVYGRRVVYYGKLSILNPESLNSGDSPNAIRVKHVKAGNNTPLSVSAAGNDITVNLATDGSGGVISTVADVAALINTDAATMNIVEARVTSYDVGVRFTMRDHLANDATISMLPNQYPAFVPQGQVIVAKEYTDASGANIEETIAYSSKTFDTLTSNSGQISRTGTTVTANTTTDHGLAVGDYIELVGTDGAPIFNGIKRVSSIGGGATPLRRFAWIEAGAAGATATARTFNIKHRLVLDSWSAWAGITVYIAGDRVKNGALVYQCAVGGTSAAAGGPTGTGSAIVDGTVTWQFLGAARPAFNHDRPTVLHTPEGVSIACYTHPVDEFTPTWWAFQGGGGIINTNTAGWAALQEYYAPGVQVYNGGKVYQLLTAGKSAASGGPTGTGPSITDGTCVWKHVGLAPTSRMNWGQDADGWLSLQVVAGVSGVPPAAGAGSNAKSNFVQLKSGKILWVGGSSAYGLAENNNSQGGASRECFLYNPKLRTWTETGKLNLHRINHTVSILNDGKVLVVGGDGRVPTQGHFSVPSVAATGEINWGLGSTVAKAGQFASATDEMYGMHSTCEIYDPSTGSWTLGPSLQAPSTTPPGNIWDESYVAGATGPTATPLLESVTRRRTQHAACNLPDGRVLICGGLGPSGQHKSFPAANVVITGEPQTTVPKVGGGTILLGPYDWQLNTLTGVSLTARGSQQIQQGVITSGGITVIDATNKIVQMSHPGRSATGAGGALSGTAPTMTFVFAGAGFLPTHANAYLVIAGASNAANNGYFRVVSVIDSDTITVTIPSGVAETLPGTAVWELFNRPNIVLGAAVITATSTRAGVSRSSTIIYNPTTGVWEPSVTSHHMLYARHIHSALPQRNGGGVVAFGGRLSWASASGPYPYADVFDPAREVWNPAADMPCNLRLQPKPGESACAIKDVDGLPFPRHSIGSEEGEKGLELSVGKFIIVGSNGGVPSFQATNVNITAINSPTVVTLASVPADLRVGSFLSQRTMDTPTISAINGTQVTFESAPQFTLILGFASYTRFDHDYKAATLYVPGLPAQSRAEHIIDPEDAEATEALEETDHNAVRDDR